MEEVLEAMARAINSTGLPWQSDMLDRDALVEGARRMLAAAEAKGWKLVPVQATEEMVDAGDACLFLTSRWTAMVAAAPSTAKEDTPDDRG